MEIARLPGHALSESEVNAPEPIWQLVHAAGKGRRLVAQAGQVERRLSILALATMKPQSPPAGAAQFEIKNTREEKLTLFQKIFSRPYRPAWVVGGIVAILAIALLFPQVRAAATAFLIFRVEQFTVVQVNSGDLPKQLGSTSSFENLLSEDVTIEELGEPQEVAGATEASDLAASGALPSEVTGDLKLEVQPEQKPPS